MREKEKKRLIRKEEKITTSRAIAVQFMQLTFIMSPSGNVDRAGKQSHA